MRVLAITAALAVAATPAFGADLTSTSAGYTYFNRPGATIAEHNKDVLACRDQAKRLTQPDTMGAVYAPGLAGAIGAAIGKAIVQAIRNNAARPINVENCMVVKGWRVVALPEAEGKAMEALEAPVLSEQISSLVGAAEPRGSVVRAYANDVAMTTTMMFEAAKNPAEEMLSLAAVGKDPDEDAKPEEDKAKVELTKAQRTAVRKAAKAPKPLKPNQLGAIPEDSALVIVHFPGAGSVLNVGFQRIAVDSDLPAGVDGRPIWFSAAQPLKSKARAEGAQGNSVVYALPPGRWRLASVTGGLFMVSFCMGSPAFDVQAGEVVYAGSFAAPETTGGFRPDLSLEPAQAVFPAFSDLAAKVRPASYVNGTTGSCGGAYAYALELPDQPYLPEYALGSRALPEPAEEAVVVQAEAEAEAAEPIVVKARASNWAGEAVAPPAEPAEAPAPAPDAEPQTTPAAVSEPAAEATPAATAS